MKDSFKQIVNDLGLQVNITVLEEQLELVCERVVLDCVELINAHAQNMEKYNFEEKASTARCCAGMLLEHFNMKEKQ